MRTATGLASDRVLMMKNFVNLAAVCNAKRRVWLHRVGAHTIADAGKCNRSDIKQGVASPFLTISKYISDRHTWSSWRHVCQQTIENTCNNASRRSTRAQPLCSFISMCVGGRVPLITATRNNFFHISFTIVQCKAQQWIHTSTPIFSIFLCSQSITAETSHNTGFHSKTTNKNMGLQSCKLYGYSKKKKLYKHQRYKSVAS